MRNAGNMRTCILISGAYNFLHFRSGLKKQNTIHISKYVFNLAYQNAGCIDAYFHKYILVLQDIRDLYNIFILLHLQNAVWNPRTSVPLECSLETTKSVSSKRLLDEKQCTGEETGKPHRQVSLHHSRFLRIFKPKSFLVCKLFFCNSESNFRFSTN